MTPASLYRRPYKEGSHDKVRSNEQYNVTQDLQFTVFLSRLARRKITKANSRENQHEDSEITGTFFFLNCSGPFQATEIITNPSLGKYTSLM